MHLTIILLCLLVQVLALIGQVCYLKSSKLWNRGKNGNRYMFYGDISLVVAIIVAGFGLLLVIIGWVVL